MFFKCGYEDDPPVYYYNECEELGNFKILFPSFSKFINRIFEEYWNKHMVRIKAQLYMLEKESGGRFSPMFTNYRANVWFESAQTSSDSFLTTDEERLIGGKTYNNIYLLILHPEYIKEQLFIGVRFDIR